MISFVVPAHNEEQLIGATLSALHAAAREVGEPYEIVVADDASTDATAEIARLQGARVVQVSYRQIGKVRNAGSRVAVGATLIFVDADTLLPSGTLRATLETLKNGAVGGGASVTFDGRLPLYASLLVPAFLGCMRLTRLAAGCYVFCSRSAFEAAGGFDERLFAAEELALSRALAREGRFEILREAVVTSGRKLRAHSGWEVLRLCGNLLRRGPSLVKSRERLSIWYGERRADPGQHSPRRSI